MKLVLVLSALIFLSGCTSAPPKNRQNICEIFYEKKGWYKDAKASRRKWGSPIPVMMSIIYQESSFQARARPPRKKFLWVLPGRRPASAYGYAQATNPTWSSYKKSTGRWAADRNNFDDAIDFIGWYNDQSYRKNGIRKTDANRLYLAYHEGQGGYRKKSYRKKAWLLDVAKKVSLRSTTYAQQLKGCEKKLRRGWFSRLF